MPELRALPELPVYIEEDHHEVLQHIYKHIGARQLPLENNTLVHFDSHPDMLIPGDLRAEDCYDKSSLFNKISIENWILPGAFAGIFRTIIWVCPPWSDQIPPGVHNFQIGRVKETGGLGVTCLESYYISEGLYTAPDKLDSVRDVKLIVLRLDESGNRLDWSDQLLTVKEQLDEVNHFILDIDLDFFSTLNPFVNLYNEANLYSQLKELYTFKPVPKDLELEERISLALELGENRSIMLNRLKSIFSFLAEEENLSTYEGLGEEYIPRVSRIVDNLRKHYPRLDIDWNLVHDAGCTFDDSELPHHISSKQEIQTLLASTEKLIDYLGKKPTVITISRSSEDDYCPPNQVEDIQSGVLSLLQLKYSGVKIHHCYLDE
ncbi:UPF0489 protein C5orf22 homolog [Eurytemora carolleeae]|uniref:UPF0489 protein C5orf22 homolog n=1 Tax=Eurytemora carolleeae TaxID=1294199 RepID=UPI000C77DEA6|nr:UPF0489 protein C5orf22 homolog [Eurytemora carolleeae]|eukprot:XP_023330378.1 UPF0489 protein C5orf22 homolog [Eurytemora affinis]